MATMVLTQAASFAATEIGANALATAAINLAAAFAGSMIDNAIFGGGKLHQEGPRLSDFAVQVSTYGKVIPIVYGQMRLAGNVIWARPLRENSNTTSSGGGKGGGGGGTETTNYSYTCSFAVAICQGPINEVLRIWADSKLLDSTIGIHSLHLGTEEQTPNSLMVSNDGLDQTPAYKGLAYVVFEDFPLGDFGNRIPNFTFEIRRTMKKPLDLEDKIKAINLIPGAGEYVYDTKIQEKIIGKQDTEGNFLQIGKRSKINLQNVDKKANVLVALDNLKRNLPNVEWVSVVVNWFADSADPAVCEIKPAVEFDETGAKVSPDEWAVGTYTRSTAHQLLRFSDGSITFGGTPTDKSIIRLCQELKDRGYKVLFYPMLQIDTITPQSKPWRGRITPTNSTQANEFFTRTKGYNDFIEHYANLTVDDTDLKDVIDGFMIGSELIGLTTYMSSTGVFPAVNKLKILAATVKSAVGSGVKVSYGGDWSEYHSTNGWYHLDPLWSDPNIDMVTIDCYFPLTPDLPQSQIDYQAVFDGWTKDEGWDYYWNEDRTTKTFYSAATYAWKNVKHWWNSTHTNPNALGTAWTAKMKPIWFSELGFPSVDGCSNQPNVFVDPKSVESYYPRGSKRRVDLIAQRTALEASLDYIDGQNSLEANFLPQCFIWSWDARPYPYFPDLLNVWGDGANWKTGHWIQGKVGLSTLARIVEDLLKKVGYTVDEYNVDSLTDRVAGYTISNRQTVRTCLEELASAYFFDMVESDGVLKFVKRGTQVSLQDIDYSEIVMGSETSSSFAINRIQELDLPKQVDVIHIMPEAEYETGTQTSIRQTTQAITTQAVNLPLVLSSVEAKSIADITLYRSWVERVQYQFSLPPRYALLEPTDLITITKGDTIYVLRINTTKLTRYGMQEISATAEEVSVYDFYRSIEVSGRTSLPFEDADVQLELLDIPSFPTDKNTDAPLRYAVTGLSGRWRGCVVYRSNDEGANYQAVQTINRQSVTGSCINALPESITHSWDRFSHVDVILIWGELESVTELAVLNGANACLVGNEIIQFQTATLISPYTYRLSNLLRGRLGTEWAVASHSASERFVMLNGLITAELLPASSWDVDKVYKAVAVGKTLPETPSQSFTYEANALKPYAPVHITGNRDGSGNLTITWKRRTRLGGEWKDKVNVPLSEETEAYEVDILDGVTVKRTFEGMNSPSITYTGSQQTADFGSPQSSVSVVIYQISALIGRGTGGKATL